MQERIIFYPEIVAFGGGERIILALTRHLRSRGIPHRMACYYKVIDLSPYSDGPLAIDELRPARNPIRKAGALRDYLHARQAAGSGNTLLVGIQAALHAGIFRPQNYVSMILDTPSLLTGEAPAQNAPQRLKKVVRDATTGRLLRRGLRGAAAVVATSQYMAGEIKQLYGCDSVVARQGGRTPPNGAHARSANGARDLRMLSVSRLEENKRIDWILRAMAGDGGKPGFDGWRLDVVGDGAQAAPLKNLANSLGMGERVTFHGHVSDAELENIYSEASIFLMPSRQGYGLPALEALSRRLPVVMHQDSGVSEILGHTPWVELVNGDIGDLSNGMRQIAGRVCAGELARLPLPEIPSESGWAEEICRICRWN